MTLQGATQLLKFKLEMLKPISVTTGPLTVLIQAQNSWFDTKQTKAQFWRSHFSHLTLLILSQV